MTASAADGDDTIYNLAGECEALFQKESFKLESRGAETLRLFNEYQQRFAAWTAYLGVFAERSICLDRKLRHHPDLRDLVMRLLDVLKTNLIESQYPYSSNSGSHHGLVLIR